MSASSCVLLIGTDSRKSPTALRGYRIFGDPRLLQVNSPERLKSALDENDVHIAVIAEPIEWYDCSLLVQDIRQRFPDCFILITSQSDNRQIVEQAVKLGLIELMGHQETAHGSKPSSTGLDISDLSALTRLQHPQSDEDSRLMQLLTHAGIGVFCCNTDGSVLRMNSVFGNLMAGSLEPNGHLIDTYNPRITASNFLSFLKDVSPSGAVSHFDLEMKQPTGELRTYRIHARRMLDADTPFQVEGLMEDVSDRRLVEKLKDRSGEAREKLSRLSSQERNVLGEVVAGSMNKTIARRFDISEKTVEKHRSNLMRKLEVSSVAELVQLANLADPMSSLGDDEQTD